jgi:hypothetical protein
MSFIFGPLIFSTIFFHIMHTWWCEYHFLCNTLSVCRPQWRKKKHVHVQTLKTYGKKCYVKNHNLHDKNTILNKFYIILNLMINLHSCFVFKIHFHWIIAKLINMISHLFLLALFSYLSHNIYIIAKITQIYIICDLQSQKNVKRRLSIMHSIKMIPSWLFSHVKCKRHFFHSHLCIDMYSFVNNLWNNVSISTWSLIGQNMFICWWHDMLK